MVAGSGGFRDREAGLTAGSRADSHEIRGLCFLYARTFSLFKIRAPISRPVSNMSELPGRCKTANICVLQPHAACVNSPVSLNCGCERIAPDTHRDQAISGESTVALAAGPPQENVGAAACPMD